MRHGVCFFKCRALHCADWQCLSPPQVRLVVFSSAAGDDVQRFLRFIFNDTCLMLRVCHPSRRSPDEWGKERGVGERKRGGGEEEGESCSSGLGALAPNTPDFSGSNSLVYARRPLPPNLRPPSRRHFPTGPVGGGSISLAEIFLSLLWDHICLVPCRHCCEGHAEQAGGVHYVTIPNGNADALEVVAPSPHAKGGRSEVPVVPCRWCAVVFNRYSA